MKHSTNKNTTFTKSLRVKKLTDGTAILENGTLTNIVDPVSSKDATSKKYVLDIVGDFSVSVVRTWKNPVNVASTESVTSLSGLLLIDNVQTLEGYRVLLKDQTDTTENGTYVVASGAWSRASDCQSGTQASGVAFYVMSGIENIKKVYVCGTSGANFGSEITFYSSGQGEPGGSSTQIQFNDSGDLGGSSSLTWNGTKLNCSALKSNNIYTNNLYTEHDKSITFGNNVNSNLAVSLYGNDNTFTINKATISQTGNINFSGNNLILSSDVTNLKTDNIVGITATDLSINNHSNIQINSDSNIYFRGNVNVIPAPVNATNSTTGSLIISGNATANNCIVGGDVHGDTYSGSVALDNGKIFVGNNLNQSQQVTMYGDATINTSGALSLTTVNSNPGTYFNSSIIVNEKGLVTFATNGASAISGLDTYIQFNNNNSFGSSDQFTFSTTTGLYVNNNISVSGSAGIDNITATNSTINSLHSSSINCQSIDIASVTSSSLINSGTSTMTNLIVTDSISFPLTNRFVPQQKIITGDATIGTDGSFSLNEILDEPNTYTSSILTVNEKGLVTFATNGALLVPSGFNDYVQFSIAEDDIGSSENFTYNTSNGLILNNNLDVQTVTVSSLDGSIITTNSLHTTSVTTTNLISTYSTISSLNATNITVSNLNTGSINIQLTNSHLLLGSLIDTEIIGDATIVSNGTLTLSTVSSVIGSFFYPNLTVDEKGRITTIENHSVTGDTDNLIQFNEFYQSWVTTPTLDATPIPSSISIYGDTMAVGVPSDNGWIGATYIFVKNGTVWEQQGPKLVGTGYTLGYLEGPEQGYSVSLYEDTLAVGGPYDYDNNIEWYEYESAAIGATWIFTRTGTVWTQQGPKLVGTGYSLNYLGYVSQGDIVSLYQDTLVVAGDQDGYDDADGYDINPGAVWVFTRTGTVWTQQGPKIQPPDVNATRTNNDIYFGSALSLYGDTFAAGTSNYYDGVETDVGAVWIYTREGTVWTQQGSKMVGTYASGTTWNGFPYTRGTQFGSEISLYENTLAVASGFYNSQGGVYIFTRTGTEWTQQGPVLVGTGYSGIGFKKEASLYQDTLVFSNDTHTWIFTRTDTVWSLFQIKDDFEYISLNQNTLALYYYNTNLVHMYNFVSENILEGSDNFKYDGLTLNINDTTESTSITTGALVISGGVGVSGIIYAKEQPIGISNSTGSMLVTTGTTTELLNIWTSTLKTGITSSTSGRFNATNSGIYLAQANISFEESTTLTSSRLSYFLINGTGVRYGTTTMRPVDTRTIINLNSILKLSAGDYVSIFVKHDAPSNLQIGSSPYTTFSLVLL